MADYFCNRVRHTAFCGNLTCSIVQWVPGCSVAQTPKKIFRLIGCLNLAISLHQICFKIDFCNREKKLTGRTDIEIEISNQFALLLANVLIYYNSAILSRLLAKYGETPNPKILALIKKISPVAWRHIHLNGHYSFRSRGQAVDLDAIVTNLILE
jgi:hypothetical protein